ncbi:MAG: hypothetical protein ACLQU1_01485 [Bryobacteraceae bacterium]
MPDSTQHPILQHRRGKLVPGEVAGRSESLPLFRRRTGLVKPPGDSTQCQHQEHATKGAAAGAAARMALSARARLAAAPA